MSDIGEAALDEAERECLRELSGFATFDPYKHDYSGCAGYSLLTLKVALWALWWSHSPRGVFFAAFRGGPPRPEWLPKWPFSARGFETIMWVALIGADADTYGAAAGPLLAAHHSVIPSRYLLHLLARDEVEELMEPCP